MLDPEELGYSLGDYICEHYLPSLDVDVIKTSLVYETTDEEKSKYNELNSIWYSKQEYYPDDSKKEWLDFLDYRYELKRKYLPKELICIVPEFDVNDFNINVIKSGLIYSLWDSDICDYEIERYDDIKFHMNNGKCKTISLYLRTEHGQN